MFPARRRTVNFKMPPESTIAALPRWWMARQVRVPWVERWLSRLLPPRCCACGEPAEVPGVDLCAICLGDLPFRPSPALEVVGLGAQYHCLPFEYAEPIAGFIQALKFHGDWRYGRVLGALLAATRAASGVALPQAVLAVPLHATRYRERGFNQAELIAQSAARWLSLPLVHHVLRRSRATIAQTTLDAARRRSNLRGAFELHERVWRGSALPRHVAIVDDVVTTGATLADAVRVLRSAGVHTVEVWAIARAGRAATPDDRVAGHADDRRGRLNAR